MGASCIGEGKPEFRYTHSNVVPFKDPRWLEFLLENNVTLSQYRSGVRISLGLYNNKEDLDRTAQVFEAGLKKLPAA